MSAVMLPTAVYIATGSEIVAGEISEKNAKHLATILKKGNINLCEIIILPDDVNMISRLLNNVRMRFDYVFISGGIGIDDKDVTAVSVAKSFDVELVVNPVLILRLKKKYPHKFANNKEPTEMRMAYLPSGAEIIENELSDVPGFVMDNVYVLPGNPKIFKAMSKKVNESLKHHVATFSHSVVFNTEESKIIDIVHYVNNKYTDVSISSHPFISCDSLSCEVLLKSKHRIHLEAATETLHTISSFIDMVYSNNTKEKRGFSVKVTEVSESSLGNAGGNEIELGFLMAEANVQNGEKIAMRCSLCHTFKKGEPHKVGPNLWNLVGEKPASKTGFDYSPAMKASEKPWSIEHLAIYIHSPQKTVPGTKMSFAGIKDNKELADLLSYLMTLNDSKISLPNKDVKVHSANMTMAPQPITQNALNQKSTPATKIIQNIVSPASVAILPKPNILFIYWDSAVTTPPAGQPRQKVDDILKQQNAPSLDFDNILTMWSGKKENEEQYDLSDYFKEEPEEYRQVKGEYDRIMNKIRNATIDQTKSGVIISMVTAAQKNIPQVVLVKNDQDAADTLSLAKEVVGYFDEIYKEVGVPDSALPSNNMIGVQADITQQYGNICWAIVNDNDEIFRAMSANCIPFFVGDPLTLTLENQQNKNIMITDFNDINYFLMLTSNPIK
ncbi:unnamed protein product [Rotaria magnacalcarata]|uniref:Cytochrome c domain-containing protein n=1 Tax=Rotaria magnacalcarata TaxID=392030 RepID=A0A816FRN5_9BILA|nr:unnamed protein product [Rotaria magnacalcarata]CAF4019238.1 unnamed protein product [Rotaria magnacalcarata]